ncbi:transmembrane protein 132D [Brachyistius frenatus]|uniref:transmembrane protein 132D n=1 Tax=Brachyistius frenatus TaxID=100188 RepID=UPI0037E75744
MDVLLKDLLPDLDQSIGPLPDNRRAPTEKLPISVFSGKVRSPRTVSGCKHRLHLWTSGPCTVLMDITIITIITITITTIIIITITTTIITITIIMSLTDFLFLTECFPPSLLQPPLSLPVQMSVVPPPWRFLPLSQADLDPLFSNSSPFTSSQNIFMLPPLGWAPPPGLQASFGPYSVTQLISEPVLPVSSPSSRLSPTLSASLFSHYVERERDGGGQERFRVRALFHRRGDLRTRTCISLHAFRETEEQRASCVVQPPLGLCVVTMTLPTDWFMDQHASQSHQELDRWYHPGVDDVQMEAQRALRHQRTSTKDQIQLYYSSLDSQLTSGCEEDRASPSQRQLFFLRAVALREVGAAQQRQTEEQQACFNGQEGEELNVDFHVVIRYQRGPVLIGQPVCVSVNLRANFSAEFVIIRLKVKKGLMSMVAQRTLTSDLWAVTLERSQGSNHDVVSIRCHKHSTLTSHESRVIVEHASLVQQEQSDINTAILTNQPVSLPVIVLATSHDGKVSDVTSAVTCRSTNENTIKVSSDCSTLFVDGSESGLGNTCGVVEFLLGTLSGSVCLEVWAPSVPLRVSLADNVLNAIEGWNVFTEEGCVPVHQRSSVQVLTQFTAQDSLSRTTHLLGSSDWFVDVTELVRDWLRVADPRVASLGPQNILIGLRPGKTSVNVVSEQWDGMLGRCEFSVTSDPVTPGDLSVQVVSGLRMSVTAGPAHPSIITTTVTAYNILYSHHQEASISVWLQFSDDTASLLSTFSDLPFFLHLSSLAESVVVVTPSPNHRIFAQGDGGGPLLRAELLVSTCADQLITSNSVSEGGAEWSDSGGGGGTRALAMGSGWIRVNLDLGVLQPGEKKDEEGEDFKLDISDVLVEFDSDEDTSNEDESVNVSTGRDDGGRTTNRKWKQVANGGMVSRNTLERAVLMPSMEEGRVYFSPSMEEEREEEEGGYGGEGGEGVEVSVGAVMSLFGLSAVLFLANCLPCALRDKRRTRTEDKEGDLEGGPAEEDEEEDLEEEQRKRRSTAAEDELMQDGEEAVNEVEIIC